MKLKMIMGVTVSAVILLSGCVQPEQDGTGVKLGFIAPLTGEAASYGESAKKAVELAKKELGSNVEIVFEDTQCDPKATVNAMSKLVNVDKVIAVIGELCSSATRAAAPIAEQNKVVLISEASTSPEITSDGDYVFRTVPSDTLQGAFGAQFVYDKGAKKLAILYSNEDYGIGFKDVLEKRFIELGGEVVDSEAVDRSATEARTQLAKIKAQSPDAVYFITNAPNTGAGIIRQLKESGLDVMLVASEGLKSEDVLTGAGISAEGMYVTSVTSGTTDFQARHKAEYNADPGPFAAQAYDAFKAIDEALDTGARTGEEVKNALYEVKFDGASGEIKFDENGDISGNYDIFIVKDGKFELVN